MSGYLPTTRPASSSYGSELENDFPVEDPTREVDATNWNKLKADAAYAARMSPLLILRISNDGATAAVAAWLGPEGFDIGGSITVNRTGTGIVEVDLTGAGFTPIFCEATAEATTGTKRGATTSLSGLVITVNCWEPNDVLRDEYFLLKVW